MARSLVQALEGIEFPCDRSRLIEYARRQEASPRSLDALAALPDRQFRDMTELFSALPSKNELGRRRATVVRIPPRERHEEEDRREEQRPQPKPSEFAESASPPPLAAPLQNEPEAEPAQPLDSPYAMMGATLQMWRTGLEMWPELARATQKLWFPWLR